MSDTTQSSVPVVPREGGRLRGLDGLRGIAAVIVLLHHCALMNAGVSDVYLDPSLPVAPGSFAAIVTRTPLQLFFSGEEAVLIFFVLSGLVVAIPPLARADFDWTAYYPRRIVRLLLPVAASVLLAVIVISTSLHDPSAAPSTWAAASTFPAIDWHEAVRDVDVLIGTAPYNNALWSLRFELLFSILLPVYVVVAAVAGRWWWAVAFGAAFAIALGAVVGDPFLLYLPIFLLGTIMAAHLSRLPALGVGRIPGRWRGVLGAVALILGVVLLEARWESAPFGTGSRAVASVVQVLEVLGAALIVLVAVAWAPFARFLELRFVQWLGRISFSLYLVHLPILIAVGWFLRAIPWYWTPVVTIPLAVLAAALFARFVEGPSHRLSQRVGRAVTRRLGARGSTSGESIGPS